MVDNYLLSLINPQRLRLLRLDYHQLSSFIAVNQIFGPYLNLNFVRLLLSITFTFCIGKQNCILTINDDKTFYHKGSFGVLFLCIVIKPFITVYHRYAIFLRPISPSTEIPELQALINNYCIIVAN